MILLSLPAQANVTLDLRAASLAQALPRLGQAYGVPMRATSAIGDEIAVFSLKGVALPELKERLAQTFAAEWRTEADGSLILNRSARLRGAEERAFGQAHRVRSPCGVCGGRSAASRRPASAGPASGSVAAMPTSSAPSGAGSGSGDRLQRRPTI